MPHRLIPSLVPLYAAGLGRHARRVVLHIGAGHGSGADGVPGTASGPTLARILADPHALPRLLDAQARHFGSTDRMAVAAVWSLRYFEHLVPPVAAAASVLGRVLPVGAAEISPRWSRDGAAWRFAVPHDGTPLPGAPTLRRYALLLDQHVHPLVEALAVHARLPRGIAWGNVARFLDMTLSRLGQAMPGIAAIGLDRRQLLDAPHFGDGTPNPLYRPVRHATRDDGARITLLRRCCLYYRLPGHGYCDACPLAPCNRRTSAGVPD
ncbi:siderophore-iron reductase FhuF [Bordetella genomosp. 9]|uniref:Siderophore-iron reductase FhuF n=1 Tax=Bordetella genomosp. 9 TaxID=1416803 RepID=A0A261RGN6_9BORD|nr:siderophore-iron reductase FhuF [Bordetella genomosp. 9]OZI23957.1 siderophore-iron reductase FhuF [Bordetella genomosp. 9]